MGLDYILAVLHHNFTLQHSEIVCKDNFRFVFAWRGEYYSFFSDKDAKIKWRLYFIDNLRGGVDGIF